ncbi:hypothetical protein [Paraburkholderia atlantica]|uniref:hypothetical protein n=1 Tax=Paraburkholderia atlantica TaxID=2654982 RepID=UPI0017AD340A|nr:hypothetical protein [Paraburkholderia atlantica]MBB5419895.1 hypothetical protein [Paraburkholderia atlantica]
MRQFDRIPVRRDVRAEIACGGRPRGTSEGRATFYQKPVELLEDLLETVPLGPNDRGHTAMDDFEHFCAYTGGCEELMGPQAFAWAKLANTDARTTASC